MAVINGTAGADALIGTAGDDEINALGGNDVIKGTAGADKIDGGAGSDIVDYSASTEGISIDLRQVTGLVGRGGDAEGDTLIGIETVIGSAFNDVLSAGPYTIATAIRLEGGAGDDIYNINMGQTPTIIEQAGGGNDEVRVSVINASGTVLAANVERMTYVGTGAFIGYGNDSDNIITGGSGNDTLFGGAGADQFIGGVGYDVAGYTDSKEAVTINLKTGVHSGIAAGDTYTDIEAIRGSNFNDTFVGDGSGIDFDGGAGVDTVDYSGSTAGVNVNVRLGTGTAGTGGDAEGTILTAIETVIGSAFNDVLSAGPYTIATAVRLEGGAGDDIYNINMGQTPTIIEQAGGGDDEVRVSTLNPSGTVLAANVERMTYVGTGAFTGYGNDSDNIITGGSGNDTLFGGAGADQFIGGVGYDVAGYTDSKEAVTINLKTGVYSGIAAGDTYTDIEVIRGSNFNDTFVGDGSGIDFDGGAGVDTVDYSGSTAGVNVNVRLGTGTAGTGGDAEGTILTAIETVIGSAFNDVLSAGPYTIATAVRLEGGAGDDIYNINMGQTPTIIEQAGGGDDEVRVSTLNPSGTVLAANVERMTYVGTGAFTGYGNDSDNIITGGSGNDTLFGGAGADQFIGGVGYDVAGYTDSKEAVTINLKTGVYSGIAAGDTYTDIEVIRGSNFNDTFVGDGSGIDFDGGAGVDTVDYSGSTAGVNVNVRLGTGTAGTGGDAEGTILTAVETVIGSAFNDVLSAGPYSIVTGVRLEGGAGDDIYNIGMGYTPTIIEQAGGGNDEVRVSTLNPSGTVLAANVERLTYVGTGAFTGYGNDSDNVITGGSGNDTLFGGAGADQFIGGAGSDIAGYTDSKEAVTINLKTGVHSGIAAGDTYTDIEAIRGSNFNDTFVGDGSGIDFDGGAGVDTVDYSGSTAGVNVNVRLGTGTAGTGGDAEGTILTAIETVIGSAFNDVLSAGPYTIATAVRLEGGAGDDIYNINMGQTPTIIEQADGGNDEVRVSTLNPSGTVLATNVERLTYVGTGAFTGYGNDSDNVITGGSGNDTLFGGAGADQFIGGAGSDIAGYTDSKEAVTINLKTGVHSGIAAGDTYTDIEAIRGSNFNDTFVGDGSGIDFDGGAGVDTVDYSGSTAGVNVNVRLGTGTAGTGGDAEGTILTAIETVIGSAFNDVLSAGPYTIATAVRLEGGAGDDIYNINMGQTPTIIEQADGGNDEVRVSVINASGTVLAANVERMTYVGTGAFIGYGNDSDNIITGGSGNDTLFGGAGADQFIGGVGYDVAGYTDSKEAVTINLKTGVYSGIAAGDTYTDIEVIRGSNFNDTFVGDGSGIDFDGGAGVDTVDYSGSTAGVNVNVRLGTGTAGTGGDAEGTILTAVETVIGSAFNDVLSAGPYTIATGVRLEGGTGDDIYNIGMGYTPTIIEQAGGGDDEVRVSTLNPSGTVLATNVERLTYVGTGAFIGYGNDSDNIITGGSGNDTLFGGAGADQFIGGAGSDIAGYTDSKEAMTINLKTGVHSGIAAGDTYTGIEVIRGSNFNDIFYGGSSSMMQDGAGGVDLVTYEQSDSAVTIDLTNGSNTGETAGHTYANIEMFQGSNFSDTLSGSGLKDIFLGGTGADVIDGRAGLDSAFYITSTTGVSINLQTQINQGGDAEGDVLLNIEHVLGSHFNDVLVGNTGVNYLEGGWGNDVIDGGDGNDYLYGGLTSSIGSFKVASSANGPQADILYGGNGNDTIVTAASDEGTQAYGEAGGDVITVAHGTADGGEGNDLLTGTGMYFSLLGGQGDDRLILQADGFANGGEGDDIYTVNTPTLVTIQDDGISSGDTLVLSYISSSELLADRIGDDLYLHRSSFDPGQAPQEGVRLKDWYAGYDTIDQIQTADMQLITLSGVNQFANDLFS
ncbi:beta strand repeat-containing protein [Pseudomonas thivervalensis]|uniref:beta strand repeat-containing protein n=4 Tax=Pseudomonas thivervalensis TaxID=86265 RepID=UPI003AF3B79F